MKRELSGESEILEAVCKPVGKILRLEFKCAGPCAGVTNVSFEEHGEEILWIGTFSGLFRLNRRTEELSLYGREAGLASQPVMSLRVDRSDRLWLGTQTSGLYRMSADGTTFVNYRHDPADPTSLSSDGVSVLFGEDSV